MSGSTVDSEEIVIRDLVKGDTVPWLRVIFDEYEIHQLVEIRIWLPVPLESRRLERITDTLSYLDRKREDFLSSRRPLEASK